MGIEMVPVKLLLGGRVVSGQPCSPHPFPGRGSIPAGGQFLQEPGFWARGSWVPVRGLVPIFWHLRASGRKKPTIIVALAASRRSSPITWRGSPLLCRLFCDYFFEEYEMEHLDKFLSIDDQTGVYLMVA